MSYIIHTNTKMKIENWIIKGAGELEGLVLPEDFDKSTTLLVGRVYGREKFPDGSLVSTSPIIKLSETHAMTRSGKVYELGEMNSDYVKFINAVKNNIPVLKDWQLTIGSTPRKFFGKRMGDENDVLNSIYGDITSHDADKNLYVFNNDMTVFIDWLSLDFGQRMEMSIEWNDEQRKGLLEFANTFRKLDLNGVHKNLF